ncbi:mechanosensitive ion channel family protein [Prolixibacter denitrificans]|uniref:Small-conductance mechanosensitive channel n=1 Tax=Prolixibacter denitrificans TaxID=1541063 RepID=A0A2P8C749_9BACT|nr:mechanosensitive ion channel domain-containing protein [Prolixibacter denitrificans]PSK80785.1 small-conductance mechanosensitive channel [Prolixibacter denitrificans]GET22415.1 hypothetical protein JCM18694_26610 [Prolixibacter denitrificans]
MFDNNYLNALVLIAGLVVGFLGAHLIIRLIKHRLHEKKDAGWIQTLTRITRPLTFLAALLVLLSIQPLMDTGKKLPFDLQHLYTLLTIFLVTWLIINAIRSIRSILLRRYNLDTKDNLKARKMHTQLRVFERILIAMVLVIAIGIALMSFDKIHKLGVSLLASAGIAGIIIGFAAQKSIGLILAGFQIAITQPIRLEDVVIVENEWGWIEEITLTYVVVRIWDKRRLILPITYFIEKPFQNWTRTTAEILGTVFIYVDYRFPVDKMREALTEILEDTDLWDGQVNVLQVTGANERTLELRALVSAVDSPTAWDLRVLVREKLVEFVQKNYPEYLPQTRVLFPEQTNNPEQVQTEHREEKS